MKENLIKIIESQKFVLIKLKHFNKDDILFFEDDEAHEIGFVKKGKIKISTFTSNGEEIVFNIINENMMFANNLVFSSSNKYLGNVIAIENVDIYLINIKDVLRLLKEDEVFLQTFLNYEADNVIKTVSKLKLSSLKTSHEKILFYLQNNNGEVIYKNISLLAKELNITRESCSRSITTLHKENKIIIDKNKKIIKKIEKK